MMIVDISAVAPARSIYGIYHGERNVRWHAWFGSEKLGVYDTEDEAVAAVEEKIAAGT